MYIHVNNVSCASSKGVPYLNWSFLNFKYDKFLVKTFQKCRLSSEMFCRQSRKVSEAAYTVDYLLTLYGIWMRFFNVGMLIAALKRNRGLSQHRH